MSSTKYRVYTCSACKNTGSAAVVREEDESRCSLCGKVVSHEGGTIYAGSADEAERFVREVVLSRNFGVNKSTPSRGKGVRKRVLETIEALTELNRGRPVTVTAVLEECSLAGISEERSRHFIRILERDDDVKVKAGFVIVGGVM